LEKIGGQNPSELELVIKTWPEFSGKAKNKIMVIAAKVKRNQ
jgi:hypothetical protein